MAINQALRHYKEALTAKESITNRMINKKVLFISYRRISNVKLSRIVLIVFESFNLYSTIFLMK